MPREHWLHRKNQEHFGRKISSFVDLFGEGHGSGVYQIALQLFWTLTSEKIHFDYSLAVFIG